MNDIEPMTRSEAAEYIPQWGSFMRAGDPGACAYGAIPPETAQHRDTLVAYLRDTCTPLAEGDDVDELPRAIAYLKSLPYDRQESDQCAR